MPVHVHYPQLRTLLIVRPKNRLTGSNPPNTTGRETPTLWALGLGYAGLIPFVGLALAAWFLGPADRGPAVTALLAYGATILSFIGAIHWGLAMRDASGAFGRLLVWGVVPSLVAWVALLITQTPGLLLVATGLWACFAVDRVVYRSCRLQAWLPMRLTLTAVASLSCLVGAMALWR